VCVRNISRNLKLGVTDKCWGGGSNETFPKFAESFAKSFGKILAKFHELKISKKHNTSYSRVLYQLC